MTKVSRIKIAPRHMGWFINNFWMVVTLLENKDQVKEFLEDLLTPTEITMFVKRLQITKMLLQGYDYRSIKNYVKVTDQTIAKINNLLFVGGNGLKKAVTYLLKIEKEQDQKLMSPPSNLREKYPGYFWPEEALEKLGTKIKASKKRGSALR